MRASLRLGRLALPLLALGACATTPAPPPEGVQEALLLPADWLYRPALATSAVPTPGTPYTAAGGAAPTAPALAAWWQWFGDPVLSNWTAAALQGNPRVASARAAWQQASAQRDAAAAALQPTLGAGASARQDSSGSGSGSGDTGRSNQTFGVALDASWSPDVFGAQQQALAAAEATQRAREATLGDVRVQVAAEAAQAVLAWRLQQLRLALALQTLASQQQTLQITDWRQQAGLVGLLELAQARAAVAQTQALVPALQTAIAQGRHTLAVLAGLPPARGPVLDDSAPPGALPMPPATLALAIPADTLRQRADVRTAEHEVAAALARVGQAEAQRWPSFTLGGSVGLSALTLGALGQGSALVSSLLAGVSLPVFDGGLRAAQLQGQQAALLQARQAHRVAVLVALQDVEDALVALQGQRLQLGSQQQAVQAAAQAEQLARQRYSSGLVDFQTVLETQRTLFGAQDAELGTRADITRSHIQLYTALGGGWAAPAGVLR
jgi:NodT family efflux transporter outer membrane factor (OMF) lipoprotein